MKIRNVLAAALRFALVLLFVLPNTGCPRKTIVFHLDPSTMLFSVDEANPPPPDQILTMTGISNIPQSGVTWEAFSDQGWLQIVPASGTLHANQPLPLSVQVDHSGLSQGLYSGTITIVARYHKNVYPQTYEVTLDVTSFGSPSEASTFE